MPKITKTPIRKFFYPDDPYNGFVEIKHLSPGEDYKIQTDCVEQKINYKSTKGKKAVKGKELVPEVTQKTDMIGLHELPIKACIVKWGGFFDANDKEMKCTPENIEAYIRMDETFVPWIKECRKILAADIAKEKEEQLKNLKASVSKSATETVEIAEAPTSGIDS